MRGSVLFPESRELPSGLRVCNYAAARDRILMLPAQALGWRGYWKHASGAFRRRCAALPHEHPPRQTTWIRVADALSRRRMQGAMSAGWHVADRRPLCACSVSESGHPDHTHTSPHRTLTVSCEENGTAVATRDALEGTRPHTARRPCGGRACVFASSAGVLLRMAPGLVEWKSHDRDHAGRA
jgi:hypothetical protein